MRLISYDCEVFAYDWLVTLKDMSTRTICEKSTYHPRFSLSSIECMTSPFQTVSFSKASSI